MLRKMKLETTNAKNVPKFVEVNNDIKGAEINSDSSVNVSASTAAGCQQQHVIDEANNKITPANFKSCSASNDNGKGESSSNDETQKPGSSKSVTNNDTTITNKEKKNGHVNIFEQDYMETVRLGITGKNIDCSNNLDESGNRTKTSSMDSDNKGTKELPGKTTAECIKMLNNISSDNTQKLDDNLDLVKIIDKMENIKVNQGATTSKLSLEKEKRESTVVNKTGLVPKQVNSKIDFNKPSSSSVLNNLKSNGKIYNQNESSKKVELVSKVNDSTEIVKQKSTLDMSSAPINEASKVDHCSEIPKCSKTVDVADCTQSDNTMEIETGNECHSVDILQNSVQVGKISNRNCDEVLKCNSKTNDIEQNCFVRMLDKKLDNTVDVTQSTNNRDIWREEKEICKYSTDTTEEVKACSSKHTDNAQPQTLTTRNDFQKEIATNDIQVQINDIQQEVTNDVQLQTKTDDVQQQIISNNNNNKYTVSAPAELNKTKPEVLLQVAPPSSKSITEIADGLSNKNISPNQIMAVNNDDNITKIIQKVNKIIDKSFKAENCLSLRCNTSQTERCFDSNIENIENYISKKYGSFIPALETDDIVDNIGAINSSSSEDHAAISSYNRSLKCSPSHTISTQTDLFPKTFKMTSNGNVSIIPKIENSQSEKIVLTKSSSSIADGTDCTCDPINKQLHTNDLIQSFNSSDKLEVKKVTHNNTCTSTKVQLNTNALMQPSNNDGQLEIKSITAKESSCKQTKTQQNTNGLIQLSNSSDRFEVMQITAKESSCSPTKVQPNTNDLIQPSTSNDKLEIKNVIAKELYCNPTKIQVNANDIMLSSSSNDKLEVKTVAAKKSSINPIKEQLNTNDLVQTFNRNDKLGVKNVTHNKTCNSTKMHLNKNDLIQSSNSSGKLEVKNGAAKVSSCNIDKIQLHTNDLIQASNNCGNLEVRKITNKESSCNPIKIQHKTNDLIQSDNSNNKFEVKHIVTAKDSSYNTTKTQTNRNHLITSSINNDKLEIKNITAKGSSCKPTKQLNTNDLIQSSSSNNKLEIKNITAKESPCKSPKVKVNTNGLIQSSTNNDKLEIKNITAKESPCKPTKQLNTNGLIQSSTNNDKLEIKNITAKESSCKSPKVKVNTNGLIHSSTNNDKLEIKNITAKESSCKSPKVKVNTNGLIQSSNNNEKVDVKNVTAKELSFKPTKIQLNTNDLIQSSNNNGKLEIKNITAKESSCKPTKVQINTKDLDNSNDRLEVKHTKETKHHHKHENKSKSDLKQKINSEVMVHGTRELENEPIPNTKTKHHRKKSCDLNNGLKPSEHFEYICTKEPNTPSDSLRLKIQRCTVKDSNCFLKNNQNAVKPKHDTCSKTKHNHKTTSDISKQDNVSSTDVQKQDSIISKHLTSVSETNPCDKSIRVNNNQEYLDMSRKVFVQSGKKNGKLVQLPMKNAVYINIKNDEKLRKEVQIKVHKLHDNISKGCHKIETNGNFESKECINGSKKLSSLVNSVDLPTTSVRSILKKRYSKEKSLELEENGKELNFNSNNGNVQKVSTSKLESECKNTQLQGIVEELTVGRTDENTLPLNSHAIPDVGNRIQNMSNINYSKVNTCNKQVNNTSQINDTKIKSKSLKSIHRTKQLNSYEENLKINTPGENLLQNNIIQMQSKDDKLKTQKSCQNILKVNNFESKTKDIKNSFEIKKSLDVKANNNWPKRLRKESQNVLHSEPMNLDSSNYQIPAQGELNLNPEGINLMGSDNYLLSEQISDPKAFYSVAKDYDVTKNKIYSNEPFMPPNFDPLKVVSLNTMDHILQNNAHYASETIDSFEDFGYSQAQEVDLSTQDLNGFSNQLYSQPDNLNVLNSNTKFSESGVNSDCGFSTFTPHLRHFISKENVCRGISESDAVVKIPSDTFKSTALLNMDKSRIQLAPCSDLSLESDSSALCLVVDKNVHKDADFELDLFSVAQEVEIYSVPDNWGQDKCQTEEWFNSLEENVCTNKAHCEQSYSQELFPAGSSTDIYLPSTSAQSLDSGLKRKHFDFESVLNDLSNLEHISTDLVFRDSMDPDKLTLHLRTVESDFSICNSQLEFKDYYLSHQDMPQSIPVPYPPQVSSDNVRASIRCPCSQCCDNRCKLFSNYNILAQYRTMKMSQDTRSCTDDSRQHLDKDHVETDCSLPLKKRKTLTQLSKPEEQEIPSYPSTPMISIAELELTNYNPTARVIVPNPQTQPLQNSSSDISLQSNYNPERPGWRFKTPAQLKEHPAPPPNSDMAINAAHTLLNLAHRTISQYGNDSGSHKKQCKRQKKSMRKH